MTIPKFLMYFGLTFMTIGCLFTADYYIGVGVFVFISGGLTVFFSYLKDL